MSKAPATKTITVNVTQEYIDKYGALLNHPCGCPIFSVLQDMHVDVDRVDYESFFLVDGREIVFPQEAEDWQRQSTLKPISFDVEIPADVEV